MSGNPDSLGWSGGPGWSGSCGGHALFWPKIGHWEKSPNLGANYAPGL